MRNQTCEKQLNAVVRIAAEKALELTDGDFKKALRLLAEWAEKDKILAAAMTQPFEVAQPSVRKPWDYENSP